MVLSLGDNSFAGPSLKLASESYSAMMWFPVTLRNSLTNPLWEALRVTFMDSERIVG
jgi:hypothetical protein